MSKNEHILVWRLSAMGDVAITIPVINQLAETYPNLKITVVSKPFFEPIFKTIPNINFIAADVKKEHKGITGLFKLFKELKKQNITHLADLHNVLRSKIIRSFFKSLGLPIAFINKGRTEKKELTKEKSKKIRQLKSTHQRYADVFTQLGFPIKLEPNKRVRKPLHNSIKNLFGEKKEKWLGIAPFAAFEGKEYPLDLMKEVISNVSELNVKIFLFGGGNEEIHKLNDLKSNHANVLNVAGQFSFENELQLISHLDLMLSMDSGNGHLSAMFGVNTLTVWGVTHPFAGFTPYMQPDENQIRPNIIEYPLLPCSIYGNKVFKGYEKVMHNIKPQIIIEKVKSELQKKEP